MPRLYSYCIPFDNGAAPNPFWGICTLNICKPVIRRIAKKGDWVVGTGSKEYGFENKVVYAMEVTDKLTMQEYEKFCRKHLLNKIPDWKSKDYRKKVGDCIYDFSSNPPLVLESVHDERNRELDIGGQYTLLSDHFYYFGNMPELLPAHLLPIVRQGQGHKSITNEPYFHDFIDWILQHAKARNTVYGEPNSSCFITTYDDCRSQCAERYKKQDDLEEEFEDDDTNIQLHLRGSEDGLSPCL